MDVQDHFCYRRRLDPRCFYVGIFNRRSIQTILFGTAGTVDIVAFFLKDPPLLLQQNRADLAKLKAAYYGWFLDTENWIKLIYDLSIDDKSCVKVADMKKASETIPDNTLKFMGACLTDQGQQTKGGKTD